jgi:hypothetical protein
LPEVRCRSTVLPPWLGPMLPWAFVRLQALASTCPTTASSREDGHDTRTADPPKRTVACAATPTAEARDANEQLVDLRAFLTRSTQPLGLLSRVSGTPEDRALLFSKAPQHRNHRSETVVAGATAFHPLPLRPGDVTDETNTDTRICTHCWAPRCTAARGRPPKWRPTRSGDPCRTTEVERRRAEARCCLFSSNHHRTGEPNTTLLWHLLLD